MAERREPAGPSRMTLLPRERNTLGNTMHALRRSTALAACVLLLLAACGKQQSATDVPLAFVPDDTPYVYANLEPLPAAVTEHWTQPMQDYWPALVTMYEGMLQDPKVDLSERSRRIVAALLGELKTHANWDRLREIGLKPDARIAFYGVGLVPVLRLELGDPAAFRAEVARVEDKAGAKMAVAKTGAQEYWQIGSDAIAAAIAIEGSHLVVTILPPNAGDALKQALLGVTRPARSLADAGALSALAKQYGFSPHGEGFVDVVRLVERLAGPLAGSDAEFAGALGLPLPSADAACGREFVEIAHKFPRLVIGAEELSLRHMRVASQLEIEPGLAARIAAALGPAPGTGAPADGAIDFSLSLPVLKLKDFWLARADAVAAAPYACASLRGLNETFAKSRARVDVTVPPPLSDLTGVRVTFSRFVYAMSAPPDAAGKLLVATSNPTAAFAMAQLSLPALQKLRIAADGKPVALPPDLLPMKLPPAAVAMSDKAIAFATGSDEIAALPAFLAAPPAAAPVFLRMHFSGEVYGWMAQSFESIKAALPPDSQKHFDQQIELFGVYRKWLRSNDFELTATPTGIAMHQTIDLNAQ